MPRDFERTGECHSNSCIFFAFKLFSVEDSAPNNLLVLAEHLKNPADIENILDNAQSKRTARSIRRQIAAHRVRQCEDNLRLLREDLQHADRDLEEVDCSIGALQDLFQKYPAAAANHPRNAMETGNVLDQKLTTFYDSGASESTSSISDVSMAAAAG